MYLIKKRGANEELVPRDRPASPCRLQRKEHTKSSHRTRVRSRVRQVHALARPGLTMVTSWPLPTPSPRRGPGPHRVTGEATARTESQAWPRPHRVTGVAPPAPSHRRGPGRELHLDKPGCPGRLQAQRLCSLGVQKSLGCGIKKISD